MTDDRFFLVHRNTPRTAHVVSKYGSVLEREYAFWMTSSTHAAHKLEQVLLVFLECGR